MIGSAESRSGGPMAVLINIHETGPLGQASPCWFFLLVSSELNAGSGGVISAILSSKGDFSSQNLAKGGLQRMKGNVSGHRPT